MKDVIARCEQLITDVDFQSIREWKAKSGQKAIAHFPVYAPVEIIHAAGALPVGLHGAGELLDIQHADARFGSFIWDYVAGVHPRFDRAKAENFLARTTIKRTSKVRELSKGMVAQLHLAIVMAIDARLLVLDEPTLGLDILYRKQFYDSLLNDYFDRSRTIIVTTHQVEEVQDVLTDLMFIDRGRIVLECSMEEFDSRYLEVMVNPEHLAAALALKPMYERPVFGRRVLLFDRVDRGQLETMGEVRRPSIADLFVAVMSPHSQNAAVSGSARREGPADQANQIGAAK